MNHINKIMVEGNAGADPEMRYTPSGMAVTNLSIASTQSRTLKSGEKKEVTTWFKVACWGKTAEAVNTYVKKGTRVIVEGTLVPDENGRPKIFMTRNNEPSSSFEINASVVYIRGAKTASGEVPEGGNVLADEDEIPF